MSFNRILAPFLVSLAVACGAADSSDSSSSEPDDTGESPSAASASTTADSPATATTSVTKSVAVTATGDVAPVSTDETPSAGEANDPAPEPIAEPSGLQYRGVNLAGAEFGTLTASSLGVEGRDYGWPTRAEIDYFQAKGMNTFRIGFAWERLQTKQFAELTPAYVAKLDDIVGYATSRGANVVLNPHNFAKYYGVHVGSAAVPASAFADLWKRLATRYAANARVMFNLVNEPAGLRTEQWVDSANAAIAAIRAAGAKNMIHVPGNAYTGAHSWNSTWYGTANAKAMLAIKDPGDNFVIEVHQYLDPDSGGKTGQCVSAKIGRERLAGWISWLRANGLKGFVGEFAGGDNALCNAAVKDMLDAMNEADDVIVGWLWWAAGPRWNPSYPFSIEPKNGVDAPQMALLTPYLP
ncbi:MAG: glycoside hydrolase family 5 protein [Labilithrix sp.]|nr:glycoside hydrolase family 5 protein [Labilithrix sp.]MCW5811169.1 glycoside hydrolase family 5 protein [Labilithrix sp.]